MSILLYFTIFDHLYRDIDQTTPDYRFDNYACELFSQLVSIF